MEKRLHFVPKLSLVELALRRVVVYLWNEADVLASIPNLRAKDHDEYEEEWRIAVESKVKNKVVELALPETLKKRMMLTVRPIGLQLKEFYMSMEEYLDYSRKYLEQLCWTSTGTINYQKTTDNLVRLGTLGVLKRFKEASFYCLVDIIPIIWEELPEHYKSYLYEETDIYAFAEMEIYWAYVMKGDESKLDEIYKRILRPHYLTFHQHAFESSACNGNKAATEYFFQKLSYEQRDDSLVNTVCKVVRRLRERVPRFGRFEILERHLSDVLCYLLSMLSPEQQMEVFKKSPSEILICFLDWPCQDFFFDIADVTFPQNI